MGERGVEEKGGGIRGRVKEMGERKVRERKRIRRNKRKYELELEEEKCKE